jgi:hypothetical protein
MADYWSILGLSNDGLIAFYRLFLPKCAEESGITLQSATFYSELANNNASITEIQQLNVNVLLRTPTTVRTT